MTYQDYLSNKFSTGKIEEISFQRIYAFAEQAVRSAINVMIPAWKQQGYSQDTLREIDNAIVQQMEYINANGATNIDMGRTRKSESIDGYSITWEKTNIMINGLEVSSTAYQCLENAFRAAGLLYRGIC